MSRFFTSDPHFFHGRVAEIRGYSSVEEHNQVIIENWKRRVKQEDQVWVLGDIVANDRYLEKAMGIIRSLPGTKHLIFGNHDSGHPMHSKSHTMHWKYLMAFLTVQSQKQMRLAGQKVLLSHFPYAADHTTPPRYPEWRMPDFGQILIHGHTHSKEIWTSAREIHVGVDAWDMTPVPQHVIERLINDSRGQGDSVESLDSQDQNS